MTRAIISKIDIRGLYGLYDYSLPDEGEFNEAVIFYGDNGSGKTTILKLVFHMLSSAPDRGHRQALYNAEFKELTITLHSGVILSATHQVTDNKRVLLLTIKRDNTRLATWEYMPKSERTREEHEILWQYTAKKESSSRTKISRKTASILTHQQPSDEDSYLNTLKEHSPTVFFVSADRKLQSDDVEESRDDYELNRFLRNSSSTKLSDIVPRSRELILDQSLSAASAWISRAALLGANQGSVNVHAVFTDIVTRLGTVSQTEESTQKGDDRETLLRTKMDEIVAWSKKHAKYELSTPLAMSDLRNALENVPRVQRHLAGILLQSYIDSVIGRLEAVEPTYLLIDKFITTLNSLLADKELTFRLSRGFVIINKLGKRLDSSQLSSGEQQLLLLFCSVITAKGAPTVFMIDEPEISLNVKWQRILVQVLLDITSTSEIQFIFASHSIELLAQHRHCVAKLRQL